MERLTIEYDGNYVPKALCSIDRYGQADGCDICHEYCMEREDKHSDVPCTNCAIQKCFNQLAKYENTNLTPEQMIQIDKDFSVQAKELGEYKELGYTPDELKLCFNPPGKIWRLDDGSEGEPVNIYKVFPVEGEQVMFCNGYVYWNCMNEYGDYEEIPLAGLDEEYFLTREEAEAKLKEMESK